MGDLGARESKESGARIAGRGQFRRRLKRRVGSIPIDLRKLRSLASMRKLGSEGPLKPWGRTLTGSGRGSRRAQLTVIWRQYPSLWIRRRLCSSWGELEIAPASVRLKSRKIRSRVRSSCSIGFQAFRQREGIITVVVGGVKLALRVSLASRGSDRRNNPILRALRMVGRCRLERSTHSVSG